MAHRKLVCPPVTNRLALGQQQLKPETPLEETAAAPDGNFVLPSPLQITTQGSVRHVPKGHRQKRAPNFQIRNE